MMTAVIGHGRSPEGRGWGDRINSASQVIRMWNWHWQSTDDYGSRYDWGVIEAHKVTIRDWMAHNQRQPAKGWIASLLMRYRGMDQELPPSARLVDQENWLKMQRPDDRGCGETGRWQLTRGGIAACWAIMNAEPGDRVVLVGFDVIRAGVSMAVEKAFSLEYTQSSGFWGLDGWKAGDTKSGNHDYPAERRLIEFLGERASVKVAFAQDCW